jgi:hypothetical protein
MKSLSCGSVVLFFAFLVLTTKAAIPVKITYGGTFADQYPIPVFYIPSVTHSGQTI